jgi:pSer/pThr/pTyr-binding forkhead associated (FHA) protein
MMARLILQFENRVLKEFAAGVMATIGRLPDNTVVIDNPAVSSHHACVYSDGNQFIVEDLQSTNGTFVNEKRITRQTLRDGDVVLVGKHQVVFDAAGSPDAVASAEGEKVLSNLGDTVYLNTAQHRALLAKLGETNAQERQAGKVGMLRVLEGRADHSEYSLEAHTSVVGSAESSVVRLKGWFKPKAAVAIARKADGYVATLLGGTTLINGKRLDGRYQLKDGDVLLVSGLKLQFRLKD